MEYFVIILLFVLIIGYGLITYYSTNNNLCVYKIPTKLIFNCSGNEIVAFDQDIFNYNNALDMDCTLINATEEYNYSYTINDCNYNVPFESQRLR